MPTKKPQGSARFRFVSLLMPSNFRLPGIVDTFCNAYRRERHGGLSARQQWFRIFDPTVTDLSTLPIGLFDINVLVLPRSLVPASEPELASFCRKLIDRGEDEEHIQLMLKTWPGDWSLQRHVSSLWAIRQHDNRLYEEIVRGRIGRGLRCLGTRNKIGDFAPEQIKTIMARQLLLWCAMDVQMIAARARLSFTAPMGSFLSSTMRVTKAGTVLRLMKRGHDFMDRALQQYADSNELDEPKPQGLEAKLIHHHAKRHILSNAKPISQYKAELDECMPVFQASVGVLADDIDRLRAYHTDELPLRRENDGRLSRRDNSLRHFHPIWYSDLTAQAGMAVALFRYVMAERHLDQMVADAHSPGRGRNRAVYEPDPLPGLPDEPEVLAPIVGRVMDLGYSCRRVHLRDPDWKSKSLPERQKIKEILEADPSLNQRAPYERAGYTFVGDALQFLKTMGRRERDARDMRHRPEDHHWTYWRMDVHPDRRLVI